MHGETMSVLVRVSFFLLAGVSMTAAQDRTLTLQVSDPMGHPISGVRIATKSKGFVGEATDVSGKTKILVGIETGAVSLELVSINDSRDLVFMQPWDERVIVPPYRKDSEDYVTVILISRKMRLLIESGGGPQTSQVASISHQSAHTPSKRAVR
jgi:hypothetical protein